MQSRDNANFKEETLKNNMTFNLHLFMHTIKKIVDSRGLKDLPRRELH